MLGEPNTEQFEVVTRVSGKEVHRQKIHDPFVRTTTTLKGFGHAWRCLTRKGLQVATFVNGSHGAMSAVMGLDPKSMMEFPTKIFDATSEHPAIYKKSSRLVAGKNFAACENHG